MPPPTNTPRPRHLPQPLPLPALRHKPTRQAGLQKPSYFQIFRIFAESNNLSGCRPPHITVSAGSLSPEFKP